VNVLETSGLSRRYGKIWALRDCTLTIPEGVLVALVGPNGAGKSTLLNIVVGLTAATTGEVRVLDGFAPGSAAALDAVAFVAQDMPLYRHLSVAELLHLARNLNRGFDHHYAQTRLSELGIGGKAKAGKLSGGQQAQVALTLALARHPRLLVLDEPTAPLDPLARHDFMATVMTAMAEDGLSVILSSHGLAELERVADHLILITHGQVRLAGTVEDLTARHRLISGAATARPEPTWQVIQSRTAGQQQHLLVHLGPHADPEPTGWRAVPVSVEEIAMAYLRDARPVHRPTPVEVSR
jgi:ABC-2 type transport system ATP-binding protein